MINIMDFLQNHNLLGLIIGLCTFLIIGIFHPIVIKAEYHFGTRCWWWFLVLGIAMVGLSLIAFGGIAGSDRIFKLLEHPGDISPAGTSAQGMVPSQPQAHLSLG